MSQLRTVEEIVQRIHQIRKFDIFGTSTELIIFLPYRHAREFLKEEATKEEWENKHQKKYTKENVIDAIKDYMPFALSKAKGHRGISASRSIECMRAWLFLLKDEELLRFSLEDHNYTNYGCPILKKICEKYDMKYPEDQGMQNMANGKPCYPGCKSGCG